MMDSRSTAGESGKRRSRRAFFLSPPADHVNREKRDETEDVHVHHVYNEETKEREGELADGLFEHPGTPIGTYVYERARVF